MTKVWEWLKKNWKWVLFPIGIIGAVITWFFFRKPGDDVGSVTPDDAADNAVNGVIRAQDDKEEAVAHLEQKHADKINKMSAEQRVEYETVKAKPIEEVASWIDKL
jgi:hypothetical protein